jgi:hypothetical protein
MWNRVNAAAPASRPDIREALLRATLEIASTGSILAYSSVGEGSRYISTHDRAVIAYGKPYGKPYEKTLEEPAMSAMIWFAPWKPGPEGDMACARDGGPAAAVVSVTEFVPYRPWTAMGVNIAGVALRQVWSDVEGAVGLWLWAVPDPLRPRSGSVTVWREEQDLRNFVARPDHLRIVRSYRDRGTLRSALWHTENFDQEATRTTARALLTGEADWPVG